MHRSVLELLKNSYGGRELKAVESRHTCYMGHRKWTPLDPTVAEDGVPLLKNVRFLIS